MQGYPFFTNKHRGIHQYNSAKQTSALVKVAEAKST